MNHLQKVIEASLIGSIRFERSAPCIPTTFHLRILSLHDIIAKRCRAKKIKDYFYDNLLNLRSASIVSIPTDNLYRK
jgi:hypothetical protein